MAFNVSGNARIDWKEMEASGRSFPEGAPHENGSYICECHACDRYFVGHKRRRICKLCSVPDRASKQGS